MKTTTLEMKKKISWVVTGRAIVDNINLVSLTKMIDGVEKENVTVGLANAVRLVKGLDSNADVEACEIDDLRKKIARKIYAFRKISLE